MAKKPLELESLKWPFVGLSVLLALSAGWAVYDEVFARRPWKNYQREFFALESKHMRADLVRIEKRLADPAVKTQRDAAVAEFKNATDAVSGNAQQRKAYDDAVRADEQAKIGEDDGKLNLGFEKSEADATYYLLREARHEGHKAEEEHLQKKMGEHDAKIKNLTDLYQAAIKRHQEATKARLAFVARREAAQASLDKFDKPAVQLKEKIATSDGKWPAMDQYWIEGLKNSWEGPTVDRCQNCHAGVNKGGFSAPWEVLEARKAKMPAADFISQFAVDPEVVDEYQTVYDKLCERTAEEPVMMPVGGWRPSPEAPARTDYKATDVCRSRAAYEELLDKSGAYCGKHRMIAKAMVVFIDSAGKVVTGEAKETAPFACFDKAVAAQLDEALKADPYDVKPVFRTHPARFDLLVKSHPPEQFGCTTCHGGEGAQTKGVLHHGFRHGKDDHHWNDPLTEEIEVLGKKYKGAFLQAKCDKCHQQELNVNHAPLLAKGKKLFTDVGCWGCHPNEGYNELPKRGPTLLNIASKTTPGWLETWIAYPKGWRPATRMPNFWPGAIDAKFVPAALDGEGKPHPEGLNEQQLLTSHKAERAEDVEAITAYLWTNSERSKLDPVPAGGNAAKGKELVESVGCRACHVFDKGDASRRSEASKERDYAPNLFNVADKAAPEWIYNWIRNPKALWPQTKMPDLRLTEAEAADITAYLVTLRTDEKYPVSAGLQPGADKAKLTALASKGKEVIAKYGCFGCHDIKGFETAQKIGTELTEHGRKEASLLDFGDVKYFTHNPQHSQTYANWIWVKLATPRIYAYERVETRMPQFDFSDDEKLALLTFLKGQTGEKPPAQYLTASDPNKAAVFAGERLVYWNGCRNCHVVEKRGGTIRDRFNEDDQSYAPPILNGEGWKVQPQWLFSFLKNPVGEAAAGTNLRPWVKIRMPTFHFADDDATNLVKYFAASSNKSFPYLTTATEKPPAERLQEAQALFTELKCLSCHVVGPLKPGQDASSAAPNLALAKSRLRPDWIPAWLANPQALMDGTRMPSFWDFSDPKNPTAPSKAFHGNGKEQTEALRDLLMHLGEVEQTGKRADAEAPKKGKRG